MEEIEFEQWLEELRNMEIKYSAVYDPTTMKIKKVGPSHAMQEEKNCIEINTEVAERILSGEVGIHSCFIDMENGDVGITETKSLIKIDDVLHRIPSSYWSQIEKPDVFLEFDSEKNTITINLSIHWGGKYNPFGEDDIPGRKISWSGDTRMEFLVTNYNDPNIIYDFFNFSIQDLIDNTLEFKIKAPHSDISVYTKRIFKNYVVEYK